MKKLTSTESLITINHFKNLLASEGIPTEVRNTLMSVEQSVAPFEVTFDAVDCASFMPVQVLEETAFLTRL